MLYDRQNPSLSALTIPAKTRQYHSLESMQFENSTSVSVSIVRKTIAINAQLVQKKGLLEALQTYNNEFTFDICPLCFFQKSLDNDGILIGEEHQLFKCPAIQDRENGFRCLQCFTPNCKSSTCKYKKE